MIQAPFEIVFEKRSTKISCLFPLHFPVGIRLPMKKIGYLNLTSGVEYTCTTREVQLSASKKDV